MARKKKNNKNQTFDVYPYLDQYQYLMRDGGSLPWYQTKGPVTEQSDQPEPEDFGWDYNATDEQYGGFPDADQREAYNEALATWQNTDKRGQFGSGRDSFTDEEWNALSTLDRNRALGNNNGGVLFIDSTIIYCRIASPFSSGTKRQATSSKRPKLKIRFLSRVAMLESM